MAVGPAHRERDRGPSFIQPALKALCESLAPQRQAAFVERHQNARHATAQDVRPLCLGSARTVRIGQFPNVDAVYPD